jgi:dsRNA-specific ribonuclease
MEGIRLTGSFLTKNLPHKLVFLDSDLQTTIDDGAASSASTHSILEDHDDDMTLETLRSDDTEILDNFIEKDDGKASVGTAETLIQLHHVTDDLSSNDVPSFANLPRNLTLNLLEDCVVNNPVADLNNHYLKKGVPEVFNSCFREKAFHVARRPHIYRSCTFICPINSTVYTCTLPQCILDKEVKESLLQSAKRAFGDFVETDDGHVVFSTKKAAKRCVAMVALYEISRSHDIDNTDCGGNLRDLAANDMDKQDRQPLVVAKSKPTPFLAEQDLNRRAKYLKRIKSKKQSIPIWVNDLYHIGVRASHLKISYQGKASESGWKCMPTMIRCVLEIDKPTSCIVTGNPLPSKELALEDAVSQLCDCLRRTKLVDSTDDLDMLDIEARQSLLACDSTVEVSYTGRDKCQPFDLDTCDTWYFYRLDLVTPSGASFVSERSGLNERIAPPLGITFPNCVSPLEFLINQEESEVMNGVTLQLNKIGTLSMDETRHACLKEFNLILDNRKQYSREEAMRLNGKVSTTMHTTFFSQDYAYYFVPLKGEHADQIDLDLLDKVATNTCCAYMEPHPWSDFCCNLLVTMKFLFAMLFLVCLTSFPGDERVQTTRNSMLLSALFGITAILHFLSLRYPRLMAHLAPDILKNHFLVQKGVNNSVYVLAANAFAEGKENLTGLSLMPTSNVTYADYYKNRYNVLIRYFSESLLPCKVATSTNKSDFLLGKEPIGDATALIPELVWLLPMPRHYLYLLNHMERPMVHLEREIELCSASDIVRRLANGINNNPATSACLCSLLGEATTIAPKPTYQRLEFLGDSVLGFYFTVILFSMNSDLAMTYDDVGACLEESIKNDELVSAALRIGANCLLFTNQRELKWHTEHSAGSVCELISDSTMSDAVESLLGATFVYDWAHQGRNASIALFEQLQLPISRQKNTNNVHISANDALSSCMTNGYPFERDSAWIKQLAALNDLMTCDQEIAKELQEKHHDLVVILSNLSANYPGSLNECDTCKILLTAALFHDDDMESIESTCDSNRSTDWTSSMDLLCLSRFRDMLFFVGTYALQLCTTTDLYHRFPEIDEGGLHVVRARAISDDIVVYIMFKAGVHNTIYKLNQDIIEAFEAKMKKADILGMQDWQARGGWVLPGGTEEFARRRRMSRSQTPQYRGFSGGRLFGKSKKLDLKYTEEPMFIMKAIIGALVLSNGMHEMWKYIGPLFEEVLLLSPKESLKAYPESTIK